MGEARADQLSTLSFSCKQWVVSYQFLLRVDPLKLMSNNFNGSTVSRNSVQYHSRIGEAELPLSWRSEKNQAEWKLPLDPQH